MNTLFNQIRKSSLIDNLDDAIRPIQEILGQIDGGHADMFFDNTSMNWGNSSEDLRLRWLVRYVEFELRFFVTN